MIESEIGKLLKNLEEEFFFSKKRNDFAKAFERISNRYRNQSGLFLQTDEERKVYLFTRLPGTFSAVCKVLEEAQSRCPQLKVESLLDVGAGPGTGMWAASEVFPSLASCTLLEKDLDFMRLGQDLAKRSVTASILQSSWKNLDIEKPLEIDSHDLILLSYSIGEIKEFAWKTLLTSLWKATKKVLVIIEPGTPAGYARLMKIRQILKSEGASLWAPCPHSLTCPLEKNDWCHFSVRVPRTALHRQFKSAELGHEDEKFSYLIFGKDSIAPFHSRIIRHPIKHSGFVELVTCQSEGIVKQTYSKKDKGLYKEKKKLAWGDVCFCEKHNL